MNLREWWCSWFHGGGDIKRDCYERINWQCRKCGRWAEPVDKQTERLIVDADIEAKLKEKIMTDPIGWIYEDDEGRMMFSQMPQPDPLWEPVYRSEPKRKWKDLTDEEIKRWKPVCADFVSFRAGVRAVEAKLKGEYGNWP